MKPRIDVRDQDVIGLDRLKAAGHEPRPVQLEHDRRRGEADRAIRRRGLALELGGRPGGLAGLLAIGPVGLDHLGSVDPADDLLGVDAGHDCAARHQLLIVVEQHRRVEVGQLDRAEDAPLAAGVAIRAATTARHAREVALSRAFGAGENGIP